MPPRSPSYARCSLTINPEAVRRFSPLSLSRKGNVKMSAAEKLPMRYPFSAVHQLCAELDNNSGGSTHGVSARHLPGYPYISLDNRGGLLEFLDKEYCSADLDRIGGRLWWMTKQDSANISPLHRQRVKRRNIVVTEDPKLHLVWINDRIFVKPLPRYLTSYAFWRDILGNDTNAAAPSRYNNVRKAALGYLRTYLYLVRSESDFYIAQDPSLHLIPSGITWEHFCNFATDLVWISNCDVSERYAYGEIRLTRLNFYAPLLLRKSHFQRVEYQYKEYFVRFYSPILFMTGIVSILLSGLQVAVAVQSVDLAPSGQMLLTVGFWSSMSIVLFFCIIPVILFAIFFYKIVKEWRYAIQDRLRLAEEGRM